MRLKINQRTYTATDACITFVTIVCFVTLLWSSLSISLVRTAIEGGYHIQGRLPDVADIISYVKPFIPSVQLGPETIFKRSKPSQKLDIVIGEKIAELQPYLQDNDEENLEFNAYKTNITEFKASISTIQSKKGVDNEIESYKANLRKFKKMRNKIKSALRREHVSNKTKVIVTEILDVLVPTLVQKQCPQGVSKNKDLVKTPRLATPSLETFIEDSVNMTNKSIDGCYINGEKFDYNECKNIKNDMYEQCQVNGRMLSEEECKQILQTIMTNVVPLLNKTFNSLFHNLENFDRNLNKTLNEIPWWNKHINDISNIRTFNTSDSHIDTFDVCQNIRLCSEELKDFCTVFYQFLHDIPVRVFRDYAAMYNRDTVDESQEKNAVITTIKHVSDNVEKRVSKIFIKLIDKIDLDKNKDREKNIAVLREFVKYVVKRVNKTVNKHLEEDLGSLRARQLLAIKEDLSQNLASDLKHFESDVIKHICSFFVTCNGKLLKKSLRSPLFREFIAARAKLNSDTNILRKTIIKHETAYISENMFPTRSNIKNNVFTETVTMKAIRINDEVDPTTKINKFTKTENTDSYDVDDEGINSYSLNITRK